MPSVTQELSAVNKQLQADDLKALASIRHAADGLLEDAAESAISVLQARRAGRAPKQDDVLAYRKALHKFADIVARGMAFGDMISRIRLVRNLDDKGAEFKRRGGMYYQSLNEQLPDFLTLPFTEAVEDLASREPIIQPDAERIADAYSSQQFVIAQSTNVGFTAQVQTTLVSVLASGGSVTDVVKLFREEGLSDSYAETVYRTNLKTAMMAGRMDMAADPDVADFIVAWSYQTAEDTDVRTTHAKMNGFKAARSSAVWELWTPPAGYNCRCTLIEVTKDEAQRLGRFTNGTFQDSAPRNVLPDPGFGGNPRRRVYS